MPASLRELPKKKKNFLTKLPFFLHDILKKHGDYMGISQIASALKTYVQVELESFIQTYLVKFIELVITASS